MAQEQIINLLKKNEEMTINDIAKILEIGIPAIQKNLRGLLKAFEVERRIMTKEEVKSVGRRFTGRNMVWFISRELHNEKQIIKNMAK